MRKKKLPLFWGIFILLSLSQGWASDIGIINGLTHEKTASPGETYETVVILKNFGARTARIKIFQKDFHFHADGRQFFPEPGKLERSNAAWITFYPRSGVLDPGEILEVKCVVKVPLDDSLNGTHWSVLVVEPEPDDPVPPRNADSKNQIKFGIAQVIQYGIQIITHLNDTGSRDLKFLNTYLHKKDDKRFLQVDVENVGERWLRPVLSVELYDEKGNRAGKFEGGRLRIYPGSSVRYEVDLTSVQVGTYKAMIILDNQDDHVFGAEYTLLFTQKTS